MLPPTEDVDGFLDDVGEVSRLIDGLAKGTITPEHVDRKIAARASSKATTCGKAAPSPPAAAAAANAATPAPSHEQQEDAAATESARHEELRRKLEELKASRQRKLQARQLYGSYVAGKQTRRQQFATDYTQWDLWCPSDEEDELFNSLTPASPQFAAMERDINSRHQRMVEQRQLAERQRQLGNAAFKAGQYSAALCCYEAGLDAQRHSMALHANAALAALKIHCHVQALEHCDKVLHLADVLHNTPNHPLCVKALQRRAAAYQALGQHSMAMADLQAAADMVPGDAEVAAQLQRAEALQQEHRTARQLAKLVAPKEAEQSGGVEPAVQDPATTTTVATSSSSNSSSEVTGLQRIKQLVSQLSSGTHAQSADAGSNCKELHALVCSAPSFGLFFRECGGLAAAANLVTATNDSASVTASLQLLSAVCVADTALQQLSKEQPQVLGAALEMCASSNTALAAAAAELAHAASTDGSCQPQLCRQLLLQAAIGAASSSSRLGGIWAVCCMQAGDEDTAALARQVLVITLLSNCTVVPAVRTALQPLVRQHPASLDALVLLLSGHDTATARVVGLLCNMASSASSDGLRASLAACQSLMRQLLLVAAAAARARTPAVAAARGTECVLAALGCLCNLSLEASVQQQLAEHEAALDALLLLATAPRANTASSGTRHAGAAKGPRLPVRGKGTAGGTDMPPVATPAECAALAERAATLLSRAAKQPAGVQRLLSKGAVPALVRTLSRETSEAAQGSAAGWTAAAVRTLALLSADAACCGEACTPADAAAAIALCCDLLRSESVADAVKGNAALVLGHYAAAGSGRWHGELAAADAVGALVAAARAGRGSATSRNAGIVLSRLAAGGGGCGKGVFLERLRELRGLEVLYEYVKP